MYERWRFQRYLIFLKMLKIRISIEKIFYYVFNNLQINVNSENSLVEVSPFSWLKSNWLIHVFRRIVWLRLIATVAVFKCNALDSRSIIALATASSA